MADTKISALSAASALAGTEVLSGVQSSTTVKITAAQIAAYVLATGGGANAALSNLASVAINTSLVSDTDVTDDLGSSSVYWNNIYANAALLKKTTNQLVLGTTNTATISASAPSASRVYTVPDAGGNDSFAFLAAAQTLTNKTISGASNTITNVSLTTGVTGDLPFANLTQGSARSVLGVTGNGTADFASIQGTTDQVFRIDGAGTGLTFGSIDLSKSATVGSSILAIANGGTGSSSGYRIDQLLAATATPTAQNNASFSQEWQWNTLAGASGLKLSSTSTVGASNLQRLFEVALSGTNGTSAQSTYGVYVTNSHAGTTSTNYGGYFSATGGTTTNYGIWANSDHFAIYGFGTATAVTAATIVGVNRTTNVNSTHWMYRGQAESTGAILDGFGAGMLFGSDLGNYAGIAGVREGAGTSGQLQLMTVNPSAVFVTRVTITRNGNFTFTQGTAQAASNTFVTYTQAAHTTGTATGFLWTAAAHTTQATTAEATSVNWNLAATVEWSTGTLAAQRAFRIQGQTIGFVGASTLTKGVTLSISGPPIAGTNATQTTGIGLEIEAANVTANTTTAYAAYFNAPTNAGTNHALGLNGSLSIVDFNVVLGTTTGTKIGTATSQKLGFYNATPVIQPAGASQAALTDSTTGTPAFTLVDVGVVFSQTNINNNFASVARMLNQMRTDLVALGLQKGAA